MVDEQEQGWLGAVQGVLPAGALREGADAEGYAVEEVCPTAVALPGSADEVAAVLRIAAEHGLAVCPMGGRTHLHLGNAPARHDLALSLERLSARVAHEPAEMVVTADAGVRLADLQRTLAAQGQWLPIDPPGSEGAPAGAGPTLGGLLAADVIGPCRLRYGGLRDQLLGVRLALADGSVVRSGGRVMKNVAGFDLCRLLTGSLGTLGIVVEATLKVQPLPQAWRMAAAPCRDLSGAARTLDAIAASELLPTFVELARVPAGDAEPWRLWLGFEGPLEAAAWQDARAREILSACGLPCSTAGQAEWQEARGALATLAAPSTEAVVCRLSLLSSDLPAVLSEVQASHPVWAHALLGTARVRLPAGEDPVPEVARLRDQVEARGGTLVVEAAPSALKPALDVWGPLRPDFPLMRAVKERFDPLGILNPGRFVGGL